MENANMGYLFVQIKKWIQELDLYREVYYCFLSRFLKMVNYLYNILHVKIEMEKCDFG